VGDVDVDDHSCEDRERERDVAIDEEEDGRNDLEESDGEVVVRNGKGSGEVCHGTGRHGRRGDEVEEHVGAEDEEDDAHQIAGDRRCDFHGASRRVIWGRRVSTVDAVRSAVDSENARERDERQAAVAGADTTACDGGDRCEDAINCRKWVGPAFPGRANPVRTSSHGGWGLARWILSRQERRESKLNLRRKLAEGVLVVTTIRFAQGHTGRARVLERERGRRSGEEV